MWAETRGAGAAVVGLTTGNGQAGLFSLANANSVAAALKVQSNGRGPAVHSVSSGSGGAGFFEATTPKGYVVALQRQNHGAGPAVVGTNRGTGVGGLFEIVNQNSLRSALVVQNLGSGAGLESRSYGLGPAARLWSANMLTAGTALEVFTAGTGTLIRADHRGSAGALALFQSNGANQIRFSKSGKGFNGGTQTGGADVAEAFGVEGRVRDYEPGDVLVISERSDRRVEMSGESYSRRVAGVYATKPGVLLTERDIDDSLDDTVPLGVLGVIPTKVSAENGAIRRGDLLVTARTPGHAMRGTAPDRMLWAVLGRALQSFAGPGSGVIDVLVSVK